MEVEGLSGARVALTVCLSEYRWHVSAEGIERIPPTLIRLWAADTCLAWSIVPFCMVGAPMVNALKASNVSRVRKICIVPKCVDVWVVLSRRVLRRFQEVESSGQPNRDGNSRSEEFLQVMALFYTSQLVRCWEGYAITGKFDSRCHFFPAHTDSTARFRSFNRDSTAL